MTKKGNKDACVQCHEPFKCTTNADPSFAVCINPACSNYALCQILASKIAQLEEEE